MPNQEYIDCQIYVSNYNDAVLHVVGWEYPGHPRLDLAYLHALLLNASLDADQYGTILFNSLFPAEDNLRAGYNAAMALARHQEKGLRFRLHIATTAPADLHNLEWERLYDPQQQQALARSQRFAFSRYLGTTENARGAVETTPKVLVIVSTPENAIERGLAPIDREQVSGIIKKAFGELAGQVEIFLDPPTRGKIRERLSKGGFDTLHIHAHAIIPANEKSARLVLETGTGEADFVDEKFFAEIFEGAPGLRLITLMACHGGVQSSEEVFSGLALTLVRQGYPAIVAMRDTIGIDTANVFIRHFYMNLVATGEVDVAANEARRQVLLNSTSENLDWSSPALFMRLKDGKLWSRPAADGVRIAPPMPPPNDSFWRPIVQWARGRKIVPVIGSGINHGVFPSNVDITELWAIEFNYAKYNFPSNNRNDLPRVARFVETIQKAPKYPHGYLVEYLKNSLLEREKIQDRDLLKDFSLSEVIARIAQRYFDKDKDDPHRVLAELPITTYLTTNPDNLMEAALTYVNRGVSQGFCRWQEGDDDQDSEYRQLRGTQENPLVFHLFGADQSPGTMVLTEDDHLDFLRLVAKDDWRIPLYVRSTLTESMLLFIGFDVRDLDFRILLKAIVAQLKRTNLGRVAVLQIEPDKNYQEKLQNVQLLQDYLDQDCNYLQVRPCWLSTRNFLIELRNRV